MDTKMITELKICDTENRQSIFGDDTILYEIPLYQRAYAWEDTQIEQLIDDIIEHDGDNYYIGSLIVHQRERLGKVVYEVIDGQQRLTTLLLLLVYLSDEAIPVNNILSFACRKKSDDTLAKLIDKREIPEEELDQGLTNGLSIIAQKFSSSQIEKAAFIEKLNHVRLYRIRVPDKTDLNRYFEIMNTRGEQLEQHDILKASLMSELSSAGAKMMFAKIWEACSDMTGYVQMHFQPISLREQLFGGRWDHSPWVNLATFSSGNDANGAAIDVDSIIADDFVVNTTDGENEKNERVRFESIIEFPYFLLHTLRVFVRSGRVTLSDDLQAQFDGSQNRQLDDKKLVKEFELVQNNGTINGTPISENKEAFSVGFIECLLKCRYLFDRYMIKREFANESADGTWSLKQLEISGRKDTKRAYYKNTELYDKGCWDQAKKNVDRNTSDMMLQSALRVSYTSPKAMHWITTLLTWLYDDSHLDMLGRFEGQIEAIAKAAVKQDFLDKENYRLGVNTPHIVFNYLDYLLWKENKAEYSDFTFEFRNSVEHWYPQHPSENTFTPWAQSEVDDFGNLCIISRKVNSRFSNMSPAAKKTTFTQMIAKGSIKLRIMADKTSGDNHTGATWVSIYKEFGSEMIQKLKNACGVTSS